MKADVADEKISVKTRIRLNSKPSKSSSGRRIISDFLWAEAWIIFMIFFLSHDSVCLFPSMTLNKTLTLTCFV